MAPPVRNTVALMGHGGVAAQRAAALGSSGRSDANDFRKLGAQGVRDGLKFATRTWVQS